MDVDDINRFGEHLRDELDKLDQFQEADRDAVQRYITTKSNDLAESTLWQYLSALRRISKYRDEPIIEIDGDGLDALAFEMMHDPELGQHGGGLSKRTVIHYQETVVTFLKSLGYEWPEDYEPMKRDRTGKVDPGEMLDAEDIQALITAANNQRDVALVEFLADTGARLTLMASLRVKDVDLDGDRAVFRPNPNAKGLKDAPIKPYPVIDSKASLRSYLRYTHPRPDDGNAAFFHKIERWDESEDGGMAPNTVRKTLKRLADRAGLDKPTNPHQFRHSAITRMWREGYSKQQIQHRVAWTLDTDMWSKYVHLHAEDMNETIFADSGAVEASSDHEKIRHPCGNCRTTLAPHHRHCPNCGEPATPEARRERDRFEDEVFDLGMDADTDTEQAVARRLRAALDDPQFVRRIFAEDGD